MKIFSWKDSVTRENLSSLSVLRFLSFDASETLSSERDTFHSIRGKNGTGPPDTQKSNTQNDGSMVRHEIEFCQLIIAFGWTVKACRRSTDRALTRQVIELTSTTLHSCLNKTRQVFCQLLFFKPFWLPVVSRASLKERWKWATTNEIVKRGEG